MNTTCPELLTDSQMARILRVNVRWLRSEAEAGRIPAVKAERRFLFSREVVARTLARKLLCFCLVCFGTCIIAIGGFQSALFADPVWKDFLLDHECEHVHENDDNVILSTGVSDAANCPYELQMGVPVGEASETSNCVGTVSTSWHDGECKPVEYCYSRRREMDPEHPSDEFRNNIECTHECEANGNDPEGPNYPCDCAAYVSDPQPEDPPSQEVWDCADFI